MSHATSTGTARERAATGCGVAGNDAKCVALANRGVEWVWRCLL